MVANLLTNIEKISKDQMARAIKVLLREYGAPIQTYKVLKTKTSSVYGGHTNRTDIPHREVIGVIVGDDFFPSDNLFAGSFQTGFLYTESEEINNGSTISIKRADGKIKKFKVTGGEVYGTTTEVLKRFNISALGD